jgi:hypothetical protein
MAIRAAFTSVFVRPGSPSGIIIMDVHSTVRKPYAALPDMQHSHYTVSIKLSQLSVKFAGGICFVHTQKKKTPAKNFFAEASLEYRWHYTLAYLSM